MYDYRSQQLAKLIESDVYRLKIVGDGDGTKWMNITPDELTRITAILTEKEGHYTLAASDVGKSTITAFGRKWLVVNFIGNVQSRDIGKRVYLQTDNAGVEDYLAVENDEQYNARMEREQA